MAEIALPVLGLGALYFTIQIKKVIKKKIMKIMGKKIIHYQIQIFQNINYPMSQRKVQSTPINND